MLQTLLQENPTPYKNMLFVGTVVVNNDSQEPTYPFTGRIKVSIPGVYEGDPTQFPWAWPKQMCLFGQGSGYGQIGIPAIGSFVVVEFQNGDPYYPVYVCSIILVNNLPTELKTNYPNRYGFKDPQGNLWFIDRTSGEVKFLHKSGATIDIVNAGDMTVSSPTTITVTAATSISLSAPVINCN